MRGRGAAAGLLWLLLAAAAAMPASGQERRDPAIVTLAADLRQGPGPGSPVLATLAAGEQVSVLGMRGDQARVEAGERRGWMPVAKLRIGAAGSGGSGGSQGGSGWLRGLTGLLGGGGSAGGGGAKVPIGVRGLQREDLARAEPDPDAVGRLERYRASPDEALAYAGEAGLASRNVADPGPPAAAAPVPAGGADR